MAHDSNTMPDLSKIKVTKIPNPQSNESDSQNSESEYFVGLLNKFVESACSESARDEQIRVLPEISRLLAEIHHLI